jgi:hypothetical protein
MHIKLIAKVVSIAAHHPLVIKAAITVGLGAANIMASNHGTVKVTIPAPIHHVCPVWGCDGPPAHPPVN